MKLNNKQQFGIGLLSVALISTFASMSVKLFRSIKEKTIRNNCENYPMANTNEMQTFKEEEIKGTVPDNDK